MKIYDKNEDYYIEVEDSKIDFVGGEDGVFACWIEGDIVHFAAGDDGHWWKIGAYHRVWCPQIVAAIKGVM